MALLAIKADETQLGPFPSLSFNRAVFILEGALDADRPPSHIGPVSN